MTKFERIVFAFLVISIILFAGCTALPGIPKIRLKNTSAATTTETTVQDTVPACTSSDGECCVDINENGLCDFEESADEADETLSRTTTTTISATSTTTKPATTLSLPVTTMEATTTTTTLQVAAAECVMGADCGETYYGGCTCRDGDVLKAKYIPTCRNGTCIYLGRTETVACRKIESNDPVKMRDSTTCISGYSICISDQDREDYMDTPNDAKIFSNLSSSDYSREYRGYRFRKAKTSYVLDNKCFDSMVFTIEIMKLNGALIQTDIAWNQTGVADDIEIGVDSIQRGFNMTDELSIWVLKT